jgi:hypothetical protein
MQPFSSRECSKKGAIVRNSIVGREAVICKDALVDDL